MAVDPAEILATRARLTELGDLPIHNIIGRFEIVGLTGLVPERKKQDVVASSRLCLRLDGEDVLAAV